MDNLTKIVLIVLVSFILLKYSLKKNKENFRNAQMEKEIKKLKKQMKLRNEALPIITGGDEKINKFIKNKNNKNTCFIYSHRNNKGKILGNFLFKLKNQKALVYQTEKGI